MKILEQTRSVIQEQLFTFTFFSEKVNGRELFHSIFRISLMLASLVLIARLLMGIDNQ